MRSGVVVSSDVPPTAGSVARLDPAHTANVVTTLPSMAHQVVLLIQEGEIERSEVRELLGTRLLREYQLDRQSSRRTLVVGAR